MALLSTVAASPRQTPKHSMATPTASSSTTCAAAFFAWLNFHHPFRFFCYHHSTGELKSSVKNENLTQTLSLFAIIKNNVKMKK